MPDSDKGIRHFLFGVLQNATWDAAKNAFGGGTLTALGAGIYQYLRHRSVDWWGLLALGVLTAAWFFLMRNRRSTSPDKPEETQIAADAPQCIDEIEADRFRREKASLESDLYRSRQARDECEQERRDVDRKLEEVNAKIAILDSYQWEALILARDLRDFYAGLGEYPEPRKRRPDEDVGEYLRYLEPYDEQQRKWEQRLTYGYSQNQFGRRITDFLFRISQEINYPVIKPDYAKDIAATKDSIPKLAQEMEMVVIGINRRERNEADLLHEKS